MSLEFASKENQDARADLRETFLKRVVSLQACRDYFGDKFHYVAKNRIHDRQQGKKCEILMHENTNIVGEFKGFDLEFQEILIDNLKTPTSTIPHSIIRGGDIISMVFTEEEIKS